MARLTKIRPIALGVIVRNNKLLVSKGYDEIKKQTFYRCLGGGIEFQETSTDALKREFIEEIGKEIKIKELLGISENIFTFNGEGGHEIVFFYSADLKDSDYQDEYPMIEDGENDKAIWMDIDDFKNNKAIVYPVEILKYL